MKGGSSGFPDNTNYPRVTEAYLYVQRDTIILSLSYDSSDPWFKVVTDFHYLYITHTHKVQNENVKIPSMKGLSGVTSVSFLLLNNPLLPKWSNESSGSAGRTSSLIKTHYMQQLSPKMMGLIRCRHLV